MDIQKRITEIEREMQQPDFWEDKDAAQDVLREYNELKARRAGSAALDDRPAIMTIFAGAGGDDAEDFVGMLYKMYTRYAERRGWQALLVQSSPNEHNGYKSITVEMSGKRAYGELKEESGVHRLVRQSPFSAKGTRHTSFAMVDVVPKLPRSEVEIKDDDLEISFARSSGPGGQNVNKRETAVRIVHTPTGLSVHADAERTQQANRERAMEILRGKLYQHFKEERERTEAGLSISKTTTAEWGNQIRSYVLHPYKQIKDHRTGVEVHDVEAALDGDIGVFIEAAKNGADSPEH